MLDPQQSESSEHVKDSIDSSTNSAVRKSPVRFLLFLVSLGAVFLTYYAKPLFNRPLGNKGEAMELQKYPDENKGERQLFEYGSQFDGYNCINERWNHRTPMYAGDFMCSYKNSYIWGMSKRGNLIWKDLSTGETHVYYKNKRNRKGIYFWLSIDGKMKIKSRSGDTLWVRKLKRFNHQKIEYRTCLKDWPCPYLHLHGDGVNVLNAYVRGEWDELNIDNHYNF
jgi:hypothetical protein